MALRSNLFDGCTAQQRVCYFLSSDFELAFCIAMHLGWNKDSCPPFRLKAEQLPEKMNFSTLVDGQRELRCTSTSPEQLFHDVHCLVHILALINYR